MSPPRFDRDDPRIQAALTELRGLIAARYPEATFEVYDDVEDPEGIYLDATVDVESIFDVIDLVSDRMVDIQVDDGLPVYVVVSRPPERVAAMLREMPPVRRRRLDLADVLATPSTSPAPPFAAPPRAASAPAKGRPR